MRTAPNAAISVMVVMLGMLSPETVQAAAITVLASQGVVSAVRDLAPAFERVSGHKVVVSFEVGPGLMNVARAGIGVAVRAGAPKPDISSTDAFERSMLAAKSVAYSRAGASGLYAVKLMERLGIADEMKSRTKLVDRVPVAELVAKGEAEIGMQQINVIPPVAGIDYVGPLPPELQDYVVFSAGVLAVSEQPEAATAMVKFMSAPEAAPLIRKSGMEPAVR